MCGGNVGVNVSHVGCAGVVVVGAASVIALLCKLVVVFKVSEFDELNRLRGRNVKA